MSQKNIIDVVTTTPAISTRQPMRWGFKKKIAVGIISLAVCFSAGVGTGLYSRPIEAINQYQIGLADGKADMNAAKTAAYQEGFNAAIKKAAEETKVIQHASYEAGYKDAVEDRENLPWHKKVGIPWPEKWPWE